MEVYILYSTNICIYILTYRPFPSVCLGTLSLFLKLFPYRRAEAGMFFAPSVGHILHTVLPHSSPACTRNIITGMVWSIHFSSLHIDSFLYTTRIRNLWSDSDPGQSMRIFFFVLRNHMYVRPATSQIIYFPPSSNPVRQVYSCTCLDLFWPPFCSFDINCPFVCQLLPF